MLRRMIGEDVELRTVLEPSLGNINADPGQIEQVIMNLIVNARDAMPRGGTITIETKNIYLDQTYVRHHVSVTPGPHVMLAVTDTGVGMEQETQKRIYEPFFTTKERGKGTGLGLSTVYGIVKQSGGNIWVYSEVDKGTTFKIYLPRISEAADMLKHDEIEFNLPQGTETILLVEDEEMVRHLAQNILESSGYDVLTAESVEDALRIASRPSVSIDLLLTDVVMPGMSGRDLATQLQSTHPEMHVLYMSGYTEDTIVHHGLLEQGINFLQKPFGPEQLLVSVREVLGQTPDENQSRLFR
ncbi:MAG TPA: ATP-binding protein [Pyrinomonadaceae bacterium]